MVNKVVDGRAVTVPAQVPKQRSSAPAVGKPLLFLLSRAEIGRFTARTATSQSWVDVVVAAVAETVAAATDLL